MAEIMDMAGHRLQSAQPEPPVAGEDYVIAGLAQGVLKLADDMALLEETAKTYPHAVKQYSLALETIARQMMTIAVTARYQSD